MRKQERGWRKRLKRKRMSAYGEEEEGRDREIGKLNQGRNA